MKDELSIACQVYFLSDAREHGWGYEDQEGHKIVMYRRYCVCMLVTTFLILIRPSCFRNVLKTAYRLVSDPAFRRTFGYKSTVTVLSKHERKFLQDYCTKHRIPSKVVLTAGYVLFKNIVLRGYVPENVPEEIVYAIRDMRCYEAMELFLKYLPDDVYRKYFIDYVPGLRRSFPWITGTDSEFEI